MNRRYAFLLLLGLVAVSAQAAPFWGAQESRPTETPPDALRPGEFIWNPAAAADGPIVVLVSLGEQRAYVYRNAVQIGVSTVSSGKTNFDTPTGVFVVLQKDRDHHSKTYNNAPMPYTQRLTWSGVALHAGGLPGYPSSHGCVHLPTRFAEALFAESPMGMTVVIVNDRTAPVVDLAHPPAFAPVDARTGSASVLPRLEADQEFRLQPEKSTYGPVSLVISGADRRVLVLRNGVEIGRARIEIADPEVPLGTHAYVLTADYLDVPHPWAPEQRMGKWVSVELPGHANEAGQVYDRNAASRIRMPEGFARAVYRMVAPGATILMTDAPVLSENMATNFTVMSDGPPAQ